MTNDKKAREFKAISSIKYDVVKGGYSKWEILPAKDPQVDGLHVIEYSAYQSLQKRVEELEKKLTDRLYRVDEDGRVSMLTCENCREIESEVTEMRIHCDAKDDHCLELETKIEKMKEAIANEITCPDCVEAIGEGYTDFLWRLFMLKPLPKKIDERIKEIAVMRSPNKSANQSHMVYGATQIATELLEIIEDLRGSLEFYAESDNYREHEENTDSLIYLDDEGFNAREALENLKDKLGESE